MIDVVDTNAHVVGINDPDWPIRTKDQEDQGYEIHKSGNAGVETQQVVNTETNQVPQTEIYSLRSRKVFHTMLVSSQINNYSNLSLKNLQATMTRDGYTATRRALRIHADICEVQNCPVCKFEIEARGYKYNPTNILNTTLITNEVHARPLFRKKTVSFAQGTIFNVQANSAILDFKRLNQAWASSSSLLETNLL